MAARQPARGWPLTSHDGNSTVIEGNDGLIVHDTGVCLEHGKLIAEEIRNISAKPIEAICYPHHPIDHSNATAALISPAEVRAGRAGIYAWDDRHLHG